MLTPSAEVICWSSTPARITMPVRVRWSQAQRHDARPRGRGRGRRGARPSSRSRGAGASTSRSVQPGQVRLDGDPVVEVRDHLVGEDHRDRDRDQRLAQLLALVPAEEDLLDDEADGADHRHRDERREDPLPGVHVAADDREPRAGHLLLHLVGDVAAEEVERAVRHVDDAHEPEDQREAARDDEQEPGGREPVQERAGEALPVVERRPEARRAPVAAELGRRARRARGCRAGRRRSRRRSGCATRSGAGVAGSSRSRAILLAPAARHPSGARPQDETNLPTGMDRFNGQPIIDSFAHPGSTGQGRARPLDAHDPTPR